MNSISSFDLTSLRSNLPTSNSSSNRSEEQKQDENHGDSLFTTSSVEVVNHATPESLKLDSDCLRITLSFLNKKDALTLNLVSKGQKNEIDQILNESQYPISLPKQLDLNGIDMIQEAREGFPSTQQLVNDAGQWDTAFIIHCLNKTKTNEGYINNKRTLLEYVALKGDMTLLSSLKQNKLINIEDVKSNDNKALRMAAKTGHVEVLRFLKNEFGLTAEDARANDNHALGLAAIFGHMEILRFLKVEFELTDDDARARNNEALRNATEFGHEKVIEFFEKEWGLTLS